MCASSESTKQLQPEAANNCGCYLGLDVEDVLYPAVIGLAPEVRTGFGVYQVGHDANPAGRPPHAPLENRSDAEFPSDCQKVLPAVLHLRGCVPSDDTQTLDFGEGVDQLLSQPVGEVLLRGIARQVLDPRLDGEATTLGRFAGMLAAGRLASARLAPVVFLASKFKPAPLTTFVEPMHTGFGRRAPPWFQSCP